MSKVLLRSDMTVITRPISFNAFKFPSRFIFRTLYVFYFFRSSGSFAHNEVALWNKEGKNFFISFGSAGKFDGNFMRFRSRCEMISSAFGIKAPKNITKKVSYDKI